MPYSVDDTLETDLVDVTQGLAEPWQRKHRDCHNDNEEHCAREQQEFLVAQQAMRQARDIEWLVIVMTVMPVSPPVARSALASLVPVLVVVAIPALTVPMVIVVAMSMFAAPAAWIEEVIQVHVSSPFCRNSRSSALIPA